MYSWAWEILFWYKYDPPHYVKQIVQSLPLFYIHA